MPRAERRRGWGGRNIQTHTTMDKATQAQRETAAAHIHAEELYDGTWRYYDDATQAHYVTPASDLDRLYELLHSDHEDERRDAYSLWCAEFSHAIEGEDEDEDEDDD